jgi:drug/metabolite transporter (DMT)-like permease
MNEADFLLGSTAALVSAAAWGLGPVLFRRLGDEVSALGMNLGRCLLGTAFLAVAVSLVGWSATDLSSLLLLAASGFLGLAVADTLFFVSIVRIGPQTAVLLSTACPVFTVVLAYLFLGERPSPLAWTGMALTIVGIGWVLGARAARRDGATTSLWGIVFGIGSALCGAVGIIISKQALGSVPTLDAALVRLAAGGLGLLAWGAVGLRFRGWLAPFREPRVFGLLSLAVVNGTCVGFFLSMYSLSRIDASTSTVLNSTDPLFVLPFAAWLLKEKISARALLGTAVAVGGVALMLVN